MNLAADLSRRCAEGGYAGRPALLADDTVWTHGRLHDTAARAATLLAARGVRPGDRVLLAAPDGPGWFVAFLATARLGAVVVLVNPDLPAADHATLLSDYRPVLCITDAGLEHRFDAAGWLDVAALPAAAADAEPAGAYPVRPDAPLYVQYTSGTTGVPKGVVHCHRDPGSYHCAVGVGVLGVRPTDVTLSVSKLYFAYGFGNAFAFPLFSGSCVVLVAQRPHPEAVRDLVARHRVSLLYAVPSAYAAMSGAADAGFASVRAAVSAGETLPLSVGERTAAMLGAPVLEQIGSTEVGHAFCANASQRRDRRLARPMNDSRDGRNTDNRPACGPL